MSRKPHSPTAQTRRDARMLSARGARQATIAALFHISEKTLRWHYRTELDEGKAEMIAAVIGALFKLIKQGKTSAAMFYTKCNGGRRAERPGDLAWAEAMNSPEARARFHEMVRCPPVEWVQLTEGDVLDQLGIARRVNDVSDDDILAAIATCETEIAMAAQGEDGDYDELFEL